MRRRGRYGKSSNGLLFLLVIILLAVLSGYMGTKYVIAPILYSERQAQEGKQSELVKDEKTTEPSVSNSPQEGKNDPKGDNTDVVVGEQEVKDLSEKPNVTKETNQSMPTEGSKSGLFCLQFGSFSNKSAADICVQELAQKNISTFVMEKEGNFKVLSIPYESKEKAKAVAEQLKPTVEDIYVVSM